MKVNPRFELGMVTLTSHIASHCERKPEFKAEIFECLRKHVEGDFSAMEFPDDVKANEEAIRTGGRIFQISKHRMEKSGLSLKRTVLRLLFCIRRITEMDAEDIRELADVFCQRECPRIICNKCSLPEFIDYVKRVE